MPLPAADLDAVIRSHTGVRGYLDYQDAMDARVQEAFAPILEPAGNRLDQMLAAILGAGKFAVAAELTVRESERAVAAGLLTDGQQLTGAGVPYNDHAISYARRARALLDQARGALDDQPLAQLRELHHDPEAVRAFDEARDLFTRQIVEFNILQEDFTEVLGIWDGRVRIATEGGVEGLFATMAEDLDQFIERRQQPARGTEHHSPLPWWKYVVIALTIGATAFAVFACFFWGACTWVWPAIAAVYPQLFGLIDRGC